MNLHIYPSYIVHESRIEKIARTLINEKTFNSIIILGIWKKGLKRSQKLHSGIKIIRVKNYFSFLPYFLRKFFDLVGLMFFCLFRFTKVDVVNCHSLNCLFIGVILKIIKGVKLIYDTHELETERNGLTGIRKVFSKKIEKLFIGYCDHIFVVGDKINRWYKHHYKLKNNVITTIFNFPNLVNKSKTQSIDIRVQNKIPYNRLIFVYVGLMIKGRGLEELITAFNQSFHHLVLIGYGPRWTKLEKKTRKINNIHVNEPLDQKHLLMFIKSADVGIFSPFNIRSLSYKYCMPNKIFEYMHAQLPIIVSSLDEVVTHINKNKIGWVVNSEEELKKLIINIKPSHIINKKKNILKVQKKYTWESQKDKLISPYLRNYD